MEYACSTWSLLLRPNECLPSEPSTRLIPSANIFLLVNLIILALLVNAHVQQHAPSAAAQRSSSRKKPQLQHTKRLLLQDDHRQAAPAEKPTESLSLEGLGEAANSSGAFPTTSAYEDRRPLPAASVENWKVDLRDPYHIQSGEDMNRTSVSAPKVHGGPYDASTAMETSIRAAAPMHENLPSEDQESSTVDSHPSNSSDAEQIVLGEDGRLRLVSGEAIDAAKTGDGGLTLADEGTEGSDAEKVVLQDDSLHIFIDRPLLVSGITSKPLKSLSDTSYCPKDDNQDTNHEINSLNDNIQHSLNANYSSLSEPIYGSANRNSPSEPNNDSANLYHSSDRALDHDLASFRSETSTVVRKRPIRVNKADSTDTHKYKDKKHLIRQSRRQDFKPLTRGLLRDSHGNINSSGNGRSSAVRREPSIGQEELNVRVESFIARFNEQIRIQRQDSMLSFMQMVDRGA